MTTAPSLVEELLADQQSLTAVEQFSRAHDEDALAPGTRYRNLIPLDTPRHGEQYAFEVELDKCSGCKACVTACHSLNGLDDNETWREVGLLVNEPKKRKRSGRAIPIHPFGIPSSGGSGTDTLKREAQTFQHITTACHHCVDPACLNGCPVLAYEKDPVTGIVRHLDDQCIGCQYCVLKCPYDVPKYNSRLGIVRKCDMCSSRLAVGEAPACVQACPNEAIRITKVQTDSVRIEFRERHENFLAGAPGGEYTLPTTRYKRAESTAPAPNLVAADRRELKPQPAHWPLVMMLVLSQAAVGMTSVAALAGVSILLWPALALGIASVAASTLHLGRPLGAWRFFLGLKRSWLSREILAFSIFLPLLAIAAVTAESSTKRTAISPSPLNGERAGVRGGIGGRHSVSEERVAVLTPHPDPLPIEGRGNGLHRASGILATLIGLIGVFCSMMIYHDTRRTLWRWPRSAALFFGTTILLGVSALLALNPSSGLLLGAVALTTLAKLGVEIGTLRHVVDWEFTSLRKSASLITGKFQNFAFARMLCAVTGGVGLPLLLHTGALNAFQTGAAWLAFALLVAGEILERLLFFRAVDAPKMPGGLPA